MLPNEVFALACRAYYDEQGLIVDKTNGHFAHCPLPRGMGETGYYLLWEHHQHQGLLQSRDVGKVCFWAGDAKKWLSTCDYWPDNYFELWDIYEEFVKQNGKPHLLNTPQSISKRTATLREKFESEKPKNLTYLHSKEVQEKATLGRLSYWRSSASEERRNQMRRKKIHNTRKVEIVFPDGRIGTYASGRLAASALGVTPGTITHWAKGQSKSPLGFSARYV